MIAFVLLTVVVGQPPAPMPDTMSKAVQEFFDEKGDDAHPVLGTKERAAFDKLPTNARDLISAAVDDGRVVSPQHLKALLGLELTPQSAELIFTDNCVLCHSDPAQMKRVCFSPDPSATGTPAHLDLKSMLSDVHFRRGLMCSGCHGGKPTDLKMSSDIGTHWPDKQVRREDRTWIPGFCARCHADPAFMRPFNPTMPTDQYAKYQESRHGKLLLEAHDSKAAQCVSCHGVHGIRGPKSRASMVHPQAVPQTCGHCHADPQYMAGYTLADGTPMPTNQLEQYTQSVHGQALLKKGDLNAPACNACHGTHSNQPTAEASMRQVCRTCHVTNAALFDGSKHKAAFEKQGWPECQKCHGKHDIARPSDALISAAPDGLCGSCHARYSQDNPKCNETASYFHATLVALQQKAQAFPATEEHLAERGLDIEPISTSATELDEAIVQLRTRVHAFDRGSFAKAAATADETLDKTEKLVEAAHVEDRFRRNGLLAAIGALGFLALMVWLKIRQLNADRARQ